MSDRPDYIPIFIISRRAGSTTLMVPPDVALSLHVGEVINLHCRPKGCELARRVTIESVEKVFDDPGKTGYYDVVQVEVTTS